MTTRWPSRCTWAIGGSPPPPLSLGCAVLLLFLLPEAAPSLKIKMWYWDYYLNWACDWTQLRSLDTFLRFWQSDVKIDSSCGHSRQAFEVNSLASYICYLPSGVLCLFSSVSPRPLLSVAGFRLHPGISPGGCETTAPQMLLGNMCYKPRSEEPGFWKQHLWLDLKGKHSCYYCSW